MSEPPGTAVSLAEAPPADAPSKPLAAQRVLPLRRPGRWIATGVALVLVAQFVHGLATNPFYQWDRFGYWFLRPTVLDGLLITLEVTALSAVLGLLGGDDGFILVPHITPSGLDVFADKVVPLLQEQGVFRTEYEGPTLRHQLGLAHPDEVADQRAAS